LVDVPVPLPRRHRVVGRVVEAADVDAVGRAHAGAQLAADALLHPVLVPVEDVPAVLARLLRALLLGVLPGDGRTSQGLEGQLEAPEEVLATARRFGLRHQRSPPSVVVAGGTGCSSARDHRRIPTAGRTALVSSRRAPMAKARVSSTPATSTAATMPTPQKPSIMKPATINSQPSESGMRRFQPRSMSWSYRSPGRAARSHTNTKRKRMV